MGIDYESARPENLWYFIGLLATDGCVYKNGRTVNITAKDKTFLESLKGPLMISNKISAKNDGMGFISHQIQIGSVRFSRFLQSIGIGPRKSLTIGPIALNFEFFSDFLRGVIDGDGSIRTWVHPTNGGVQWSVRIFSASPSFISWLSAEIDARLKARGALHKGKSSVYVLKFGKMAAQVILRSCYYPGCLALERKRVLASRCVVSANGWRRSRTIGQVAELVYATDSTMGLPGGDFGVINPSNSGKANSSR